MGAKGQDGVVGLPGEKVCSCMEVCNREMFTLTAAYL